MSMFHANINYYIIIIRVTIQHQYSDQYPCILMYTVSFIQYNRVWVQCPSHLIPEHFVRPMDPHGFPWSPRTCLHLQLSQRLRSWHFGNKSTYFHIILELFITIQLKKISLYKKNCGCGMYFHVKVYRITQQKWVEKY